MKVTYSIDALNDVVKQLLKQASHKTILFYGDLGSGKTTLIKALVNALGSEDHVKSPTFSIVNEYQTKNTILYHFDLYRIKTIEEAYNFGIEDYLDTKHWVFIEWPELIETILPEQTHCVYITVNNDLSRTLTLI